MERVLWEGDNSEINVLEGLIFFFFFKEQSNFEEIGVIQSSMNK